MLNATKSFFEMHFGWMCMIVVVISPLAMTGAFAQATNLNDLPNQLSVPKVTDGAPGPGFRVWDKLPVYQDSSIAHALYLPTDWKAGQKYPVIFEYPGNGGFRNALGDTSAGTVDGCRLGYGLSQGKHAIWVCLPFVDSERREHALNWWGEPEETARYCMAAVEMVCDRWGGDRQRLILCGFSRGALATSYIGLRDDKIASLWCGLFAHSHFDGVRKWPYADSDAASAVIRLRRFANKPQWISHEQSTQATSEFLRQHGLLHENVELVELPFANHSADWLLKDLPIAHQARRWWQATIGAR